MDKKLVVFLVCSILTAPAVAEPLVRKANFDPEAGPNRYTVIFPPEYGSSEVYMPIVGGSFELETDADLGTARILSWTQEIEPILIFGKSTGAITISLNPDEGSEGTFDSAARRFSVSATFLIAFDDTELREYGFFSPVSLRGTENGSIRGVGSIGSISMYIEGQGAFAGGTFSYTCQTTARSEYLLLDDQAQPGDVNHDRTLDISDPVDILGTLFLGGSMRCHDAAEVNGDQIVNMADGVYLLNFLFLGGPLPPADPVPCPAGE